MVRHIILWTLKNEFNNDEIRLNMKQNLEALKGKIPGLLEMHIVTEKLDSSNADVMLNSLFEDEAALKNYSTHPKHVYVADTFVRPFTQTRTCIDFNQD